MARFRIGTPGPRRRETPLERNTRVNGRAPPPPSDPFRAARPPPVPVPTPIVREPFISPSMPTSARFLSSLRSRHEQRAPSAKARLDFSAEDISSRSSPSTSARRPVRDEVAEKLDVLKAHINSLVRLKKWRDALAKIEEALSLHPNCWDLQLQQAHVQHKMLAAQVDERARSFAEELKRRRAQRRTQRAREEWDGVTRKHRPRVRTHYEVLGVDANASSDQIKKSYRALVRLHHPDKTRGDSDEEIKCITQAHRVLSDPKARARYDLSLRANRT